jgi:hypothetical protein
MPCEAFGSPNFAFMRHQCVRSATGADRGGSNGARMQRWKRKLQGFANEIGPAVTIANLPPGTSKGTASSIASSRLSEGDEGALIGETSRILWTESWVWHGVERRRPTAGG